MKIAICSYFDKNILSYAFYTNKINQYYCNKYNYDYITSFSPKLKKLTAHYERYILLLNVIKKYDWVIWIDADAYFYTDSPPIHKLIKHIQFSHSSILSFSIKQYISKNYKNYYINNGIFLLKNCEDNIKFLKKMTDFQDIKKSAEEKHYIFDQSIFRYLYCQNYENFKRNSLVLNYGVLQHFYSYELPFLSNKPYILHMAGQTNYERNKIVKFYYIKNIIFIEKKSFLFTLLMAYVFFKGYQLYQIVFRDYL